MTFPSAWLAKMDICCRIRKKKVRCMKRHHCGYLLYILKEHVGNSPRSRTVLPIRTWCYLFIPVLWELSHAAQSKEQNANL